MKSQQQGTGGTKAKMKVPDHKELLFHLGKHCVPKQLHSNSKAYTLLGQNYPGSKYKVKTWTEFWRKQSGFVCLVGVGGGVCSRPGDESLTGQTTECIKGSNRLERVMATGLVVKDLKSSYLMVEAIGNHCSFLSSEVMWLDLHSKNRTLTVFGGWAREEGDPLGECCSTGKRWQTSQVAALCLEVEITALVKGKAEGVTLGAALEGDMK